MEMILCISRANSGGFPQMYNNASRILSSKFGHHHATVITTARDSHTSHRHLDKSANSCCSCVSRTRWKTSWIASTWCQEVMLPLTISARSRGVTRYLCNRSRLTAAQNPYKRQHCVTCAGTDPVSRLLMLPDCMQLWLHLLRLTAAWK